jgi:hypothetical protein
MPLLTSAKESREPKDMIVRINRIVKTLMKFFTAVPFSLPVLSKQIFIYIYRTFCMITLVVVSVYMDERAHLRNAVAIKYSI